MDTEAEILEVIRMLKEQGNKVVPLSYVITLVMAKTGKAETTIRYHIRKLAIQGLIKLISKGKAKYIELDLN